MSGAPPLGRTRERRLRDVARLRVAGARLLVALAAAALAPPLGAQRLNVRQYTQLDGLPQGQVFAIHQDGDGYLWVGTYGGLSRYDGHRFNTVTARDGLPSNTVQAIAELYTGELLVGARGGVCVVQREVRDCVSTVSERGEDAVNDLNVDPDGAVWVATDAGVALIRDMRVRRVYGVADGLPAARVYGITRDVERRLWAATDAGLARHVDGGWVHYPLGPGWRAATRAVAATPRGILVGSEVGLFESDGTGGFRAVPLRGGPVAVLDIAVDRGGAAWVLTAAGLHRYEGGAAAWYTVANGMPSVSVREVVPDREGNIWIGSDEGLTKFVPGPLALHGNEGLPSSFVRTLAADRAGVLWAGTRDGVARWNGARFEPVPLGAGVPTRVYSSAPTDDGGMLFGTSTGLVHLRAGRTRVYTTADGLPADFVLSLQPRPGDGGVWLGTEQGLALWRGGRIEAAPAVVSGPEYVPIDMTYDLDGALWLGLRSGGAAVFAGDSVRRLVAADGLSDEIVWALDVDGEGGVWLGTNGDGAFHVRGEEIRQLTSDDGLVNDFVWQVEADRRGDVWFYTNLGLDRLRGDAITHYDRSDGLLELEGSATASFEAADGRLWFGSMAGAYLFDPDRERPAPPPSRVFVESMHVGTHEVPLDDARVPPRAGSISFRLSVPTYRDEASVRVRYRLGEDEGWSEPLEEPVVRFAGLGHGAYTLEVVAETDAGQRSDEVSVVAFTVLPSFWQTWWFRALLVVLVGCAAAGVHLARHSAFEAETGRLESLVADRTQELREKTTRLESEIAEREASERVRIALEDRLRQSQKMEAVGRLAGGIAHDFNNLLTSVLGHAEIVNEDLGTSHPAAPDLREIATAAERGADLVDQLLQFSRQEMIHRRPVDVAESVRGALRMLERLLGADIELTIDAAEGPLWVLGDRGQLDQIVVNLAVNARDAMPQGGTLEIRVMSQFVHEPIDLSGLESLPRGAYVRLSVEDSGRGMDAETQRRAFEPFYTTKGVGEGTGLGLATVYGIVHQHDGFIHVQSEEGRGTGIYVFFPVCEAPARQETAAEPGEAMPPPGGRVVLVAEDEAPVRRLISRTLARAGHVVLHAEDGAEALRILRERDGPVDLVITDVIMPEMSGRELADRMKGLYPEVPVLFLSGYTADLLGERGQIEPGVELLNKPFGGAELLERVAELLGGADRAA